MEEDIYPFLCERLAGIFGQSDIQPIVANSLDDPKLVYEYHDDSFGPVSTGVLTLRVLAKTYREAAERAAKIKPQLVLLAEAPSLLSKHCAVRCALAGGGRLFDPGLKVYDITQIYTLKYKVRC